MTRVAKRRIGIPAALFAGAVLMQEGVAQAPPPGVFSEIQTAVVPRTRSALEPATMRSRVVQVDTQKITAARRGREVLKLNLFDDEVVEVQIKRVRPTSSGYFISGSPKGKEWGDVRLVVNGPVMVGTVVTPEGEFTIRSTGSGRHIVRQVNPSAEPFECEVLDPPPSRPEQAISSIDSPFSTARPPAQQVAETPTEDGSEVRVLVVYTPAAQDREGGGAGIRALIDLMVQTANQAFEDGGINPRLVLAHTAKVDYSGVTTSTDLSRLIATEDGYMDEVHMLRNRFTADLVHLLTAAAIGTGGSAVRLRSEELFSERSAAFAVTANGREKSFTHEIGHNFGLRHDRHVDSPAGAIYPYAFGYSNQRALQPGAPVSSRWRTIMSYPRQCNDAGLSCAQLIRFSNPDQTYLGDPLGVPASDPSTGSDGPADARLTINNTSSFVGSFRSEACTDFTVSPATRIAPADGGEIIFNVATMPGCLWEAESQSDFLSISRDALNAGIRDVRITVEKNQTGAERTGTLSLAGHTVTVRQLATTEGVCGRSPLVMEALTKKAGFSDAGDCAQVTDAHLAGITYLAFAIDSVRSLKEGDFDGLTGLLTLGLPSSRLTDLPEGLFAGLASLNNLYLARNELTHLPAGIFAGLTGLEVLDLSSNQLAGLPAGLFAGLSDLRELDLGGNDVARLPEGFFADLSNLERLRLNDNSLTELSASHFSGLTRLELLKLDSNQLSELPAGLFANLSNLEELGLASNAILDVHENAFAGLLNLKKLNLGQGQFATLPNSLLTGLHNLETLSLWDANLSVLPDGLFNGLGNLQDLNLYSNNLSGLPPGVFGGLLKLEKLTLGRNKLTSLPSDLFAGLTALRELNLDGNRLSSLPDRLFSGLTGLEKLYLGANSEDPLPLLLSLETAGSDQFKATVPTGAPFALDIPVEVSGAGEIRDGVSSVMIPEGALESVQLEVTRAAGTEEPVSVDFGALPGLPTGHSGYALTRDQTLPRRILGSSLSADATLIDLSLSEGTIEPGFSAHTTRYAALVHNETSTVTLAPVRSNVEATIAYLDAGDQALTDADTSVEGHQVNLGVGQNMIKVRVTAKDATTTQTYTLVITRDSAINVCTRTPQIRTAILAALGVSECTSVTNEHLSAITELDLDRKGISSLKSGDFAGLSALKTLDFYANDIAALPADVFAGLVALESLDLGVNEVARLPNGVFSDLASLEYLSLNYNNLSSLRADDFSALAALSSLKLSGNALYSLPADLFSHLTTLEEIHLGSNRLSVLPADLFSGLSELQLLSLGYNRLQDLPAGIFSGLPALQKLYLSSNRISHLPDGIFSGLTQLQVLRLERNSINPLELSLSLKKVGENQLQAVAPTGVPFTLDFPINISSAGEVEGDLSTASIPSGATESALLSINRVSGTADSVTVSIGAMPELPEGHQGYAFAAEDVLPLEVLPSVTPSKDAALRHLSLSPGTLDSSFTQDTTNYSVSFPNAVTSVTLAPKTSNHNASVEFLDASDQSLVDAQPAADGHQVNLSVGGNTIKIKVRSEDATTTRTYTLLVTRNSVPQITSPSPFSAEENQTAVATLAATDADGDEISWWTNGGADAGRFNLTAGGVLTFVTAPDYESPEDLDGDNAYVVVAQASDGNDDAYQTLTVQVTDVDEPSSDASLRGLSLSDGTLAPAFASATTRYTATVANGVFLVTMTATPRDADASLRYLDASDQVKEDADTITYGHQVQLQAGENTIKVEVTSADEATTEIYTLMVKRNRVPSITTASPLSVEENGTAVATLAATDADDDEVSWSINGGADADQFDLTAAGVLAFVTAPDYESPGDADEDNAYVIVVRASDGADTADLTLTVNVTGVEEALSDASLRGLSLSSGALDPAFASAATSYTVKVANSVSSVTVTPVTGDSDASVRYLDAGDQVKEDDDTTTDGQQVDLDEGANTIKVEVKSADGTTTRNYTVVVTRNRVPEITTASPVSVEESTTAVATLAATDADDDEVSWSTNGGADADQFDLTAAGVLTFVTAPDYESPGDADGNNAYLVVVRASDGTDAGELTLTVQVTEVEEASSDASLRGLSLSSGALDPAFSSGTTSYTATVANTVSSLTVNATRTDSEATLEYLDASDQVKDDDDTTADGHQVNLSVGANTIKVKVTAEDTTTTETYTVVVTRNSVPEITTASPVSVEESTTAVVTLAATDADDDEVSWSTNGGADADQFDLTAAGVLTFVTAPDYESPGDADGNNAYLVVVRASDGTDAGELTLTVQVTEVEEASSDASLRGLSLSSGALDPAFSSGTTSYTATVANTVSSLTVNATRTDSEATLEYLDANDQVLDDADSDTDGQQVNLSVGANTIKVEVTAEDTTTTETYTVVVTRNSVPVITTTSPVAAEENQTAVATLAATDADSDTITWSKNGGVDARLFDLTSGGVLTFASAPDYESPADDGENNAHVVVVRVSDGADTADLTLTVNVTDVDERVDSTDATLSGLSLSSGTLDPSFAAATMDYTARVTNATTSITVTPSRADDGSTLEYLDANDQVLDDADSDTDGQQVNLSVGANTIKVKVTAEDTTTTETYTVVVTRNSVPVITTTSPVSVEENQTAVATLAATDADSDTITWSKNGGVDARLFDLTSGGVLTFASAPDYESPADDGENNAHVVVVRVSDGADTADLTLTVNVTDVSEVEVLSDNTSLSNLTLSSGTLVPDFDTSITRYAALVENATSSITVTPTKSDSNATLVYLDANDQTLADADPNTSGQQVSLSVGANTIKMRVTSGDETETQTHTVVVTRNNLPVFTTTSPISVEENSTFVADLEATDAENHELTWYIAGGFDSSRFTVTSEGELTFKSAPDFENPADSNENNDYVVTVGVRDALDVSGLDLIINVTDVDERVDSTDATLSGLSLSSGTLDPSFAASTMDYTARVTNATTSITVTPSRADDGSTLEYLDANDQVLDDADSDTDGQQVNLSVGANTIKVEVTAEDTTTTETYTVVVTRNSVPVITTTSPVSVEENQTAVATLAATDADSDTITWSKNGGVDARLFDLTSGGVLTFASAPDYESPADDGENNAHVVVVRVSDGADTADLTLTVNVTDVSEVEVLSDNTSLSNLTLSSGTLVPDFDTSITRYAALVENATSSITVTPTKSDSNATLVYLDANDQTLADADPNTSGQQVSLSVGANTIKMRVTSGDETETQTHTVVVTRNNLPVFTTTSPISVEENSTFVADLEATDAENHELTWYIAGGFDSSRFTVTSEGELTFKSAPDFENPADSNENNDYVVTVGVRDALDVSGLDLIINVTDVDERVDSTDATLSGLSLSSGTLDPSFAASTMDYTARVTNATTSITVTPSRADDGSTLEYLDANDQVLDDADSDTDGQQVNLSVGANTIKVEVTAEDTTTTETYTVVVTRNSVPVITTTSPVSVEENQTAVATLAATDADSDTITWSKNGGVDARLFDLTSGGVLTFASAPDYESPADDGENNAHVVVVRVSDGADTADLTLTVNVTDVDERVDSTDATLSGLSLSSGTLDPSFAAATMDYTARVTNATTSITVTPSRADDGSTLEYLDANDQVLDDADSDTSGQQVNLSVGANTIKVEVTAEDTTTTETYTVVVTRNSVPVITTTSPVAAEENQTAAATLAATDADNDTITWSKNGGVDESRFEVTSAGLLTFAAAPDFESPADADGDNDYVVVVRASDGTDATHLTLTVTVADVEEALPSSDDATLSALSLSSGTLDPVFASNTTSYTATVASSVSSITVSATRNDSNATLAYLDEDDQVLDDADANTDGQQVDLDVGDNTIKVEVTAEDTTTTETYTIVVTRESPRGGVCGRTKQVRDELVHLISGVDSCEDVTASHLAAITTLNLLENNISSLKSDDFDGMTGLRDLRLGRNQLTSIPEDIFSGLDALTHLYLAANKLDSLPSDLFSELPQLQVLDLGNNELSSLPSDIFSGLTSLSSLRLMFNEFSSLPSDIFSGLTALKSLSLEGNEFSSLPSDIFSGFTALTGLGLDQNKFVSLPAGLLSGLDTLQQLSLQSNRLTTLRSGDFSGLTALKWLFLYDNLLISLPSGGFSDLTALIELELYDNELASLPSDAFSGLTALTELDLGFNDLTSLPSDAFSGLTALTELDLGFNDLTSLPSSIFSGLTALTELDLGYNDLTSLPSGVFSGLTALSSLELSGNDLSSLPDGLLSGLTELDSFSISFNSVRIPISVSLEKVGSSEFKAVVPVGAPFAMDLPVSVSSDGEIDDDVTTVMVSTGAVDSDAVGVTRKDGTQGKITVDIGPLPALPRYHSGYELEKDGSLPLTVLEAVSGSSTDAVIADASYADVNGNGRIEGDDAMIIYHAIESAGSLGDGETGGTSGTRATLLAGLAGASGSGDDALREMLSKAKEWRDVGVEVGGDLNGNGAIGSDDAMIMYYAYQFENLVGDGETGGTARFRRSLLAELASRPDPGDADLKSMLRNAHALRAAAAEAVQ